MKIVLADDESLARLYLRSTLCEIDLSVSIVAEAKNGLELLEQLERHQPDIVFADIRMPKLDGLSAIRRGKEISPHTQWVVLSSYSKFEYAQEALALGVHHYFLKPASPSDLRQSINQIRQKSFQHLTTLNNEFENTMVSLLHHCLSVTDIDSDSPLRHYPMTGYLLYLDGVPVRSTKSSWHGSLVSEIRKIAMQHLFDKDSRISLTALPEGQIALVYASTGPVMRSVLGFEQSLTELVERYALTNKHSVMPFQTGTCKGIEPLLQAFAELKRLSHLRAVLPAGRIMKLKDLLSGREMSERQLASLVALGQRVEKIADRFHAGDYHHYAKEVSLLSMELKAVSSEAAYPIEGCVQRFLERATGAEIDETGMENWLRKLETYGEKKLLSAVETGGDSRDLAKIVMEYVDKNYMRDIGIGQIAHELGVTYNYLSTIFHKKRGMTFMSYLTQTRMLKAKELLVSNPHLKIQDVASQVGYYSTRHFTKAFTKQFNCYPSEYRAGTHSLI